MAIVAETRLALQQWEIGPLQVVRVSPEAALEPRLSFHFFGNIDLPESFGKREVSITWWSGHLAALNGSMFVAQLILAEPFWVPRTKNGRAHLEFTMFADLGWARLARIEASRSQKGPDFHFRLIPRFVVDGIPVDQSWVSFNGAVPLEDWQRVLEAFGADRFEIVQLRFPRGSTEPVVGARDRLNEARAYLERGEFEGAMFACRKALEALAKVVESGKPTEVLKKKVTDVLGVKKGDEIGRVISGLMSFLHLAAHESGAGDFCRMDSEFAIRQTAAIVALVAECLGKPMANLVAG